MITLTVRDLKKKESKIEIFASKDKAETRLQSLIVDPDVAEKATKGYYLESYSFDENAEKALIEGYLPEGRKMQGDLLK